MSNGEPHRPRGDARPIAEVRRLRALVERLYCDYRTTGATIRAARKLGLSPATTKRRLKEIREEWERNAEEDRPHRIEQTRAAISRDLRKARKAEQWAAVVSLTRLLAEVDGVRAPERFEVRKLDDYDPTLLTDEELAQKMALDAKARRAG